MKYLIFSLTLISFNCFSNPACEETKAYIELKNLVEDIYAQDYLRCKRSAKQTAYWKSVANCISNEESKDPFVCGKLLAHTLVKADSTHCELLKPSDVIIKQRIIEQVKIEKVDVCKT